MSYVDFIPNKDIPEIPELLQEVTPNPPKVLTLPVTTQNLTLAQEITATPTQTPATQSLILVTTGTEALAIVAHPAAQKTETPIAAIQNQAAVATSTTPTPNLPRSQPAILVP